MELVNLMVPLFCAIRRPPNQLYALLALCWVNLTLTHCAKLHPLAKPIAFVFKGFMRIRTLTWSLVMTCWMFKEKTIHFSNQIWHVQAATGSRCPIILKALLNMSYKSYFII